MTQYHTLRTRNGCTDMTPDPAGEWVRREDYEALRASEAAALDRVKVLTEALTFYAVATYYGNADGSGHAFHNDTWDEGEIARAALTPTANKE